MEAQNVRRATTLPDAERLSGVIFKYAASIGSESDPDMLLRLNADMARDFVEADRCSIWLRDLSTHELWTKVAHGTTEIRIPDTYGLVGACIASNEPILVNDTSHDSRFEAAVDRHSGYVTHSALVLPLRSPGGGVIGALQVLNKPGGFQDDDIHLLGLAASYAASAIFAQRLRQEAEAARLLYRELEIARDVQSRLFPKQLPAVDGFDIAAHCRPAKFVGGDYYDFIRYSDTEYAFTVGDVSGKGISAAVLMASLQASLRAQITRAGGSLAQIVADFNQALCASSSPDRYSTLFVAVLDPLGRRLTYVNAGHVPPVLLRSSGPAQYLDCGGCPAGFFDDATYEQAHVDLETGDVLVCFSDGITEATNAKDEIWDKSAIDAVLLSGRYLSAAALIGQLVAAADDYTGSAEQSDDMTVVVLRVL